MAVRAVGLALVIENHRSRSSRSIGPGGHVRMKRWRRFTQQHPLGSAQLVLCARINDALFRSRSCMRSSVVPCCAFQPCVSYDGAYVASRGGGPFTSAPCAVPCAGSDPGTRCLAMPACTSTVACAATSSSHRCPVVVACTAAMAMCPAPGASKARANEVCAKGLHGET